LAVELEKEINEMLDVGYNYSQIRALFREKGVEIGEATLKARKKARRRDKKNVAVEGAKERITATETATKTAAPSGRFAVRPDTAEL